MNHRTRLFMTGFIHVCMVALSTYLIAHRLLLGVFVVGCVLSYVWAGNVKRVSIGDQTDRIIYALGAGLGSLTGTIISGYL